MMRKTIFSLIAGVLLTISLKAQEYNASMFGIVSDGIQNNTGAIQYAIDFISQKGGGKLNFFVGRYVTGSVDLKSNVTVELHEGAVLVASSNWNDYIPTNSHIRALLKADSVTNFKLIGKGVIEAQPQNFTTLTKDLNEKGHYKIKEKDYPSLLHIENSKQIIVDGILFQNFVNKGIVVKSSEDLQLQNLTIRSSFPNTSGAEFFESKVSTMQQIYFETAAKAVVKDDSSIFTSTAKCITANGKSVF